MSPIDVSEEFQPRWRHSASLVVIDGNTYTVFSVKWVVDL